MKLRLFVIFIVFTGFLTISCSPKKEIKDKVQDKKTDSVKTEKRTFSDSTGLLGKYDITSEDPQILKLSSNLMEISGITFTNDNRLYAHGDEYGDIFDLNPENGKLIKMFSLGDIKVIKGDFEDIAFVNDRFFMVESKGKLYEFTDAPSGVFIEYKTYKTPLTTVNNVEGLCYDPETNSLLLACKDSGGEELGKDKAVYSFSLESMSMNEKPRFIIPKKTIKDNTEEGKFSPSGIARNPISGTFFMIAAKGNTIIELSKKGDVIGQADLPESVHKQAEGIAFNSEGTMYISDEGRGNTPIIAIYPLKK